VCKRAFSNVSFTVLDLNKKEFKVETKAGTETLLEVCQSYDIDVEAACGGECCCSTCHCYIENGLYEKVEEPDEDELDMLDLAIDLREGASRLACQIKITEVFNGATIQMAETVENHMND